MVYSQPDDQTLVPSLPCARTEAEANAYSSVVAVVIPSYRVRAHIMPLLARIDPAVAHIFVVDDACPEGSGAYVVAECRDRRVVVLTHEKNQGAGGAVIDGAVSSNPEQNGLVTNLFARQRIL